MIKLDIVPVTRIVATGAIIAQVAFVNVVLAMAGFTGVGGIATLLGWLVASVTASLGMFPQQFKIGLQMIECLFIETHDICIAAFVVRVANRALFRSDLRRPTMKPDSRVDVRRHIFVAIETQQPLRLTIKAFMA